MTFFILLLCNGDVTMSQMLFSSTCYAVVHKWRNVECFLVNLATSPDGIVSLGDGKFGVVEVKCPYKHRKNTIKEACKDSSFCLSNRDSQIALDCHPVDRSAKIKSPCRCFSSSYIFSLSQVVLQLDLSHPAHSSATFKSPSRQFSYNQCTQ